jgi:hypothetical protein
MKYNKNNNIFFIYSYYIYIYIFQQREGLELVFFS